MDYQKADCALYRVPPLDMTTINSRVEQLLVEAWKNGQSVEAALQSISRNNSVVGDLVSQIAENLAFQQRMASDAVNDASGNRIQSYEEQRAEELYQIEQAFGTVKGTQVASVRAAEEETAEEKQEYTMAQQKLSEMRARIKARLKEVGGEEGLKYLLQIDELVEEEALYGVDTSVAGTGQESGNYEVGQQNYDPGTTQPSRPYKQSQSSSASGKGYENTLQPSAGDGSYVDIFELGAETGRLKYGNKNQGRRADDKKDEKKKHRPGLPGAAARARAARRRSKAAEEAELELIMSLVDGKREIDPLYDPSSVEAIADRELMPHEPGKEREKPGRWKRFKKKAWKVLNYKLW
jgi:hypothetical protein